MCHIDFFPWAFFLHTLPNQLPLTQYVFSCLTSTLPWTLCDASISTTTKMFTCMGKAWLMVICKMKQEQNETRIKRNKNETKQERNETRMKPNKNETKQERNQTRMKPNKNETKQERNQTRTKPNKNETKQERGWGGELPQISHLQHPNYFPTGNRLQPKTDFHHTFHLWFAHWVQRICIVASKSARE